MPSWRHYSRIPWCLLRSILWRILCDGCPVDFCALPPHVIVDQLNRSFELSILVALLWSIDWSCARRAGRILKH